MASKGKDVETDDNFVSVSDQGSDEGIHSEKVIPCFGEQPSFRVWHSPRIQQRFNPQSTRLVDQSELLDHLR